MKRTYSGYEHIYQDYEGFMPSPGDVALCGHVLTEPETPEAEPCSTCHEHFDSQEELESTKFLQAHETTRTGAAPFPPDSSLDTVLTSTSISAQAILDICDKVEDPSDEEAEEDWDDDWQDKPELLARFQKMADALKPGNAWWPLVKKSFEDGLEHQADDDLDLEEWAAGVLADPANWSHVRGGDYDDLHWDVWNSLDVHEGSGFVLVTASDGSMAFEEVYLL